MDKYFNVAGPCFPAKHYMMPALRDGYVNRAHIPFPVSIALVGMLDVRDYKAQIRPDGESLGQISPFNVITEDLMLRNFTEADDIITAKETIIRRDPIHLFYLFDMMKHPRIEPFFRDTISGKDIKAENDVEFRVAAFAAQAIDVCESMVSKIGKAHLQDQLFRAATSVAANYAEACVPESRKDFAHKTNIALKELIETRMWLRIIAMRNYADHNLVSHLLQETEELIKIFYASVTTARRNLNEQDGR